MSSLHEAISPLVPQRNNSQQLSSIFLLGTMVMLQRFCYYGLRSILTLYLFYEFAEGGLGFTQENTFLIYSWFTLAIYIFPIIAGLLIDFLTGLKNGLLIGLGISVIGYSLMVPHNMWINFIALSLIVIGTSFSQLSLNVIFGRLFQKEDKRRDLGFMVFYLFINIGAFFSSIVIGLVGEIYGWMYGFGFVAIIMFILNVMYFFLRNRIEQAQVETNSVIPSSPPPLSPTRKPFDTRIALAFLFMILSVLFWGLFEVTAGVSNEIINSIADLGPLNQIFNPIFLLILSLILGMIWFIKKVPSAILRIGASFVFMGVGTLILLWLISLQAESEVSHSTTWGLLISMIGLQTLGEIFISPLAMSHITRLSPVKYSAIIMGAFFLLSGIGNRFFVWLEENMVREFDWTNASFVIPTIAVAFILGILILLLKKPLQKLGNGID